MAGPLLFKSGTFLNVFYIIFNYCDSNFLCTLVPLCLPVEPLKWILDFLCATELKICKIKIDDEAVLMLSTKQNMHHWTR